MSTQPNDPSGESDQLTIEEVLRSARPFPAREDMVIDDLSEEEQEAFWAAITE